MKMAPKETTTANQSLEAALSQNVGENYKHQIGTQVINAVHNSLVHILGAEVDEISSEAKIVENLGAESIDGLYIFFEIEKELETANIPRYRNILITEGNTQQTVLGLAKLFYEDYIKNLR